MCLKLLNDNTADITAKQTSEVGPQHYIRYVPEVSCANKFSKILQILWNSKKENSRHAEEQYIIPGSVTVII
jgi:hypothetical protein